MWDRKQKGFELVAYVDCFRPVTDLAAHHHDRSGRGGDWSRISGGGAPAGASDVYPAVNVDELPKSAARARALSSRHEAPQMVVGVPRPVCGSDLMAAFRDTARRESSRLNAISPVPLHKPRGCLGAPAASGLDGRCLKEVAELFARVIDLKSAFTHRHSRGVAEVAAHLADALGFNTEEVTWMRIAGLLHDLGKLSVPDEILEKPTALTREEFAVVKQHAYHTYRILRDAGVPEPIPQWAAFHHEQLNGNGYPFHLDAPQLPLGSLIMAAADVFTALRENRPYRPGMQRDGIERIMREMVRENVLDDHVVRVTFDYYETLENLLDTPEV